MGFPRVATEDAMRIEEQVVGQRKFLIDRVKSPWAKAAVVLATVLAIIIWMAFFEKVWGAPAAASSAPSAVLRPQAGETITPITPPAQGQVSPDSLYPGNGGPWTFAKSLKLPYHTVSYHIYNQYHVPVLRQMRGHQICPDGYHAIWTEIAEIANGTNGAVSPDATSGTPQYCRVNKQAIMDTKDAIECSGAGVVGFSTGGPKGFYAGVLGCTWAKMMN